MLFATYIYGAGRGEHALINATIDVGVAISRSHLQYLTPAIIIATATTTITVSATTASSASTIIISLAMLLPTTTTHTYVCIVAPC